MCNSIHKIWFKDFFIQFKFRENIQFNTLFTERGLYFHLYVYNVVIFKSSQTSPLKVYVKKYNFRIRIGRIFNTDSWINSLNFSKHLFGSRTTIQLYRVGTYLRFVLSDPEREKSKLEFRMSFSHWCVELIRLYIYFWIQR